MSFAKNVKAKEIAFVGNLCHIAKRNTIRNTQRMIRRAIRTTCTSALPRTFRNLIIVSFVFDPRTSQMIATRSDRYS